MKIINKIPYYLFAVGIFILLKLSYSFVDNDDLTFLLKPVSNLIVLLTGSKSVYLPDIGYYHENLNIVVEKSCSGFNFWILCFIMLTFLSLKYFERSFHKVLIIPMALLASYFFTIFVNTSRIFTSIILQGQANNFLPSRPHYMLHEIVGIITNLAFLILIYILTQKILIKKPSHAKLT